MSKFVLENDLLALRLMDDKDITEEYISWLADSKVMKYTEVGSIRITKQSQKKYLEQQRKTNKFYAVIFKEHSKHIGNLKVYNFREESGLLVCEFSRMIGDKDYWGMGLGTLLSKMARDLAIQNLHVDIVLASCKKDNKAAIKSNLKAGFRVDNITDSAINFFFRR